MHNILHVKYTSLYIPHVIYDTEFHRFFRLVPVVVVPETEFRDFERRSEPGLNILTLVELELRDVVGDWDLPGLTLFSRITLSGRTKEPCLALHLKYRCPDTEPSCLPGEERVVNNVLREGVISKAVLFVNNVEKRIMGLNLGNVRLVHVMIACLRKSDF